MEVDMIFWLKYFLEWEKCPTTTTAILSFSDFKNNTFYAQDRTGKVFLFYIQFQTWAKSYCGAKSF